MQQFGISVCAKSIKKIGLLVVMTCYSRVIKI